MSNNTNQPPPWSEAPPWAMWRAQDFDGVWVFFESEPTQSKSGGWWNRATVNLPSICSGVLNPFWRDTLEKRPNDE